MKNNQIRRVGNGQNKRGSIGDHRAGEQIGERRHLGFAYRSQNCRSEHHGSCIIGHEDRDQRAHAINQGEEADAGTVRTFQRGGGKPVKDAVLTGQFGQQHHANEKEIDVGAFSGRLSCQLEWNQPQGDQQDRPTANPVDFWDVAWPNQHQQDADGDDQG